MLVVRSLLGQRCDLEVRPHRQLSSVKLGHL